MARITVEDCLDNIDNIFEMVLVAAKRARRVAHGAEPMVELENDKPTVMALREIADGLLSAETLAAAEQREEEASKSPEQELAEELDGQRNALHQCLDQVQGKSKRALKMRYFDDLKPAEIASPQRERV